MSVLTPIINNINGETRRIYLKQGISDFYPIEDLYHEYRTLRRTNESLRVWSPLIKAEGNVPKGGGAFTPRYVVLLDGTKIVPYDESLQINQLGDMITDDPDTDSSLYDISGLTTAKPIFIKPSEAETIQLNSSAIEYSTFQMSVWLDPSSENSGTGYPMGNREYPVNNWDDAVSIANNRGFAKIGLLGNSTINGTTNVEGFEIFGQSHVNTKLIILDTALTEKATFADLNVEGVLDGGSEINNCMVGDLSYVNGHVHNSSLYGIITLDGDSNAVFSNCQVVDLHNLPIMDMGGTGQDLILTNWKGHLTIRNMNGPEDDIAIGMDSGSIVLEDTITNGNVTLTGVGAIIDNSTGTANVNHVNLVKGQQLNDIYSLTTASAYAGQVFLDFTNGSAGVELPIGLVSNPVNNLTDAKAILAAHGGNKIWVAGSLTLDQAIMGYHFKDWVNADIDLNGQNTSGTKFEELRITGIQVGFSIFLTCGIHSVTNMLGVYDKCNFSDNLTNTIASGQIIISDGRSAVGGDDSPTFDLSAGNIDMSVRAYSGGIKLLNSNSSGNIATIEFIAGRLNAGPTNILGFLSARGTFSRNDTSGENYVVDYSGANIQVSEIWAENLHDYLEIDTAGGLVHDINFLDPSVFIDTELGINGNGTGSSPFNNIPDAIDFAESRGWKKLKLLSDATIDRTLKNFVIEGIGNLPTIDFNGQNVDKSEFLKVKLTGEQVGSITAREVILLNLQGVNGVYKDSGIIGNIILADDAIVTIASASNIPVNTTAAPNIINMGNGAASAVLNLRKYSGGIELTNVNNSNRIATCEFAGGKLVINGTNTDGIIRVGGIPDTAVDDTSAGTLVNVDGVFAGANTISDQVWDEQISEHLIAGSTGSQLATASSGGVDYDTLSQAVWDRNLSTHTIVGSAGKLVQTTHDVEAGSWELSKITNQMIFKDPAGLEMFRVNLFDEGGNPSVEEVYKRTRI